MIKRCVVVLATLFLAAPAQAVPFDWPSFAMTHDGAETRGPLAARGGGGFADLAAGRVGATASPRTAISLFVDLMTFDRDATIAFRQTTRAWMRTGADGAAGLGPLVAGSVRVYDVSWLSFDPTEPPSIWEPLPYGVDFYKETVVGESFFGATMSVEPTEFCDSGVRSCLGLGVAPSKRGATVAASLAGSFEARAGAIYALLVRTVASGGDARAETDFAFTDLGGARASTKSGVVAGSRPQPAPVPLPAPAMLLIAACGALAAARARRRST